MSATVVLIGYGGVADASSSPEWMRALRQNGGVARVQIIGKPGCHLCENAEVVVARVCAELGETYEVVSILDDPELADRYFEEIPVILVDGRQHDFWRVNEERLRRALSDNRA